MKRWGKYRLLLTASLLTFSSLLVGVSDTQAEKMDQSVRYSREYQTPTFIGPIWENKQRLSKKKEAVLAFLNEKKQLFRMQSKLDPSVKVVKEQTDSLGQTHFRLQQVYRGLNVYGADFTVHLNQKNDVTAYLGR